MKTIYQCKRKKKKRKCLKRKENNDTKKKAENDKISKQQKSGNGSMRTNDIVKATSENDFHTNERGNTILIKKKGGKPLKKNRKSHLNKSQECEHAKAHKAKPQ